MLTGIVIDGRVRLPANLGDHEAFRRWARSDDCPEKGHFGYLNGLLWVDLTLEQLHSHNQLKAEFSRVLGDLIRTRATGRFAGGMLLTHLGAGLSTIPDGLFVSYHGLQTGRVRGIPNTRNVGVIELEGNPEMVLEVVSDSSVEKDTILLQALYHAAKIDEFWRADGRGELTFEIFRWTPTGYVPTQLPDGWWHSDVFGRDFRLEQATDPLGEPLYTLHHR